MGDPNEIYVRVVICIDDVVGDIVAYVTEQSTIEEDLQINDDGRIFALINRLNDEFDINIEPSDKVSWKTVADIVDFVYNCIRD